MGVLAIREATGAMGLEIGEGCTSVVVHWSDTLAVKD